MVRRLAAILAADVVGYSSLMSEDQSGTLDALRQFRSEVFEPRVAGFNGAVIKRMGDGWLVEFASLSEAVDCALSIQESLSEQDRLRLRIGIHLGEVIFEDEDVFGNGVNIAARLEGLAQAGQVVISDTAYANLERILASRFVEGREARLKNIPGTVTVWCCPATAQISEVGVLPSVQSVTPSQPIVDGLDGGPPSQVPDASIAVMPLTMLGSPEQAYIAQGFTMDLQHCLTRSPDLLVAGRSSCKAANGRELDPQEVARTLGVSHVLQGSLRMAGDRARLSLELISGRDGTVRWSEVYERSVDQLTSLEAEVAHEVVGGLALQIDRALFEAGLDQSPDRLGEYDWRLRGNYFLESGGSGGFQKAKDCFLEALKINPRSAPALAGLSMCYGYECDTLATRNFGECLRNHLDYAEQAVAADETDSRGYYAMSCALMFDGQFDRADFHASYGLELNPSEYHNICNRGYSTMALGRLDESVNFFSQSLRRNPLAPNSCLLAVGLIEYVEGNYGQSAQAANRLTAYQIQRAGTMAAACAQVGYDKQAQAAKELFYKLCEDLPAAPQNSASGDWNSFWQQAYPYLRDDTLAGLLEGMRKAGLPT